MRFSYAFKALSKISWKLEDEEVVAVVVMGWELGIMVAGMKRFVRAQAEGMMEVR